MNEEMLRALCDELEAMHDAINAIANYLSANDRMGDFRLGTELTLRHLDIARGERNAAYKRRD